MKFLSSIYHFLGSVQLAILLIAAVVCFVIAGTVIESATGSHRYAAYLTYHNRIFILLLWGFFVNILVSALRRWPFKWHHVPFLITHLGLLMILGGTLIKGYVGVQGSMSLLEGSGSHEILVPDTHVVLLEKRDATDPRNTVRKGFPFTKKWFGGIESAIPLEAPFNELQMHVVSYTPHSREFFETWIKGDEVFIDGVTPFPIQEWNDSESHFVPRATVNINGQEWDIIALRAAYPESAAKKIYLDRMDVRISDAVSRQKRYEGPLLSLLENEIDVDGIKVRGELRLNFSQILGFEDPELVVNIANGHKEAIAISLNGEEALLNRNRKFPWNVDLFQKGKPAIVLVQDFYNDLFLFTFGKYGDVHSEIFRQDNLENIIVADQGFGGYWTQTEIVSIKDRESCEREHIEQVTQQLQHHLLSDETLSPPLLLLKNACNEAKVVFPRTCMAFLDHWNRHSSWLFPEDAVITEDLALVLKRIDWSSIPKKDLQGCYWTCMLFKELESKLQKDEDVVDILHTMGWPLIAPLKALKKSDAEAILSTFTQQIFAIVDQFPPMGEISHNQNARLLSAYLRVYQIHLSRIGTPKAIVEQKGQLQCPLTVYQKEELPQNMLEENHPKITLRLQKGPFVDWKTVTLDRFGQGLKWPVYNGEYLIRFQPQHQEIPYRVRLRHARQIHYPNSSQPYSYEGDLLITDLNTRDVVEKSVSMNHVYETWDGYRFYLANMSPGSEGAVKRVQLVVNYDPAKYWLTYPGAFILSLGIILLFWFRK